MGMNILGSAFSFSQLEEEKENKKEENKKEEENKEKELDGKQ